MKTNSATSLSQWFTITDIGDAANVHELLEANAVVTICKTLLLIIHLPTLEVYVEMALNLSDGDYQTIAPNVIVI